MRTTMAVAALTAAATVYADDIHQLPRSDAQLAVHARVECLDDNRQCAVSHLCAEDWTGIAAQDFTHLGAISKGELHRTPVVADPSQSCAVRVEGKANIVAVVEHRDASGAALSREHLVVYRSGALLVDMNPGPDGIAAGYGDCRPALWRERVCPDAEHLTGLRDGCDGAGCRPAFEAETDCRLEAEYDNPDGLRRSFVCTCPDSVGDAYISDYANNDWRFGLPVPAEVDEGQRLELQTVVDGGESRVVLGDDTFWRASHGILRQTPHPSAGSSGNGNLARWRAPMVTGDLRVKFTATTLIQVGRPYRASVNVPGANPRWGNVCATTSVYVTVRDKG